MRKDPEKKQAGKERRKKRLAAIISICLSIAVVITAIVRNNRLYDDKPAPAG